MSSLVNIRSKPWDSDAAATATAASLTDSSGGTASQTIAAIGATYDQAEVRNAVASLADEVNKLITDVANIRSFLDGSKG